MGIFFAIILEFYIIYVITLLFFIYFLPYGKHNTNDKGYKSFAVKNCSFVLVMSKTNKI